MFPPLLFKRKTTTIKKDPESELITLLHSILLVFCPEREILHTQLITLITAFPTLLECIFQQSTTIHLICTSTGCIQDESILTCILKHTHWKAWSIQDKEGRTALHLLCRNILISTTSLSSAIQYAPEMASVTDIYGKVPLHYLLKTSNDNDNETPTFSLLLALSTTATLCTSDTSGEMPLELICAFCKDIEMILPSLLKLWKTEKDPTQMNKEGKSRCLHALVRNEASSLTLFQLVVITLEIDLDLPDENGEYALHHLCRNEIAINETYLVHVMAWSEGLISSSISTTPLHVLCMNPQIDVPLLTVLFTDSNQKKYDCTSDIHALNPLHYLARNPTIEMKILTLFLKVCPIAASMADKNNRFPLHHLCMNPKVTLNMITILLDSFPSAAYSMDTDYKLPHHYLFTNSDLKKEDVNEISFRLQQILPLALNQYEIHHENYLNDGTTSYNDDDMIADLGMDIHSYENVLLLYYANEAYMHNDRDLRTLLYTTDTAYPLSSRLLAIVPCSPRKKNKTEMTDRSYPHLMVVEAPIGPLKRTKIDDVRFKDILISVSKCLFAWHTRDYIHGNIQTSSIYRYADTTFRFLTIDQACLIGEVRTLCTKNIHLTSPEMAHSFLHEKDELIIAHAAQDVWQLGLFIFEMSTDKSFVQAVCPWASHLSHEGILHLLASLNDNVVNNIISAENLSMPLVTVLKVLLAVHPRDRWCMQDVLNLPLFQKKKILSLKESPIESTSPYKAHIVVSPLQAEVHVAKNTACKNCIMSTSQIKHLVQESTQLTDRLKTLHTEKTMLKMKLEGMVEKYCIVQREKDTLQISLDQLLPSHDAVKDQLDTSMRMLLTLSPLATQVYGDKADQFLSSTLHSAVNHHNIP